MSGVLGIDIGAQNAVVMTVKAGHVNCVLNSESKRQSPTLVSFDNDHREIASAARTCWRRQYKNTISEIKRFVGLEGTKEAIDYESQFVGNAKQIKTTADNTVAFDVQYRGEKSEFRNEQAYAALLGELVDMAATNVKLPAILSRDKFQVVLSVPSYFTARQRKAVLNSARIANVHCLRVINDTTALALKYGFQEQRSIGPDGTTTVMFLDLGASDYSVSIARIKHKSVEVLGDVSVPRLGGREIDLMLCKHFAKTAKEIAKGCSYSSWW